MWLAMSIVVLTLGMAPMIAQSADHLDAPGLTPPSGRLDADINDVFVFEGEDPSRTVIAVTTHPAVGVFSSPNYATDVDYTINVDRNGDAVQDLAYVARFSAPAGGSQDYTITRYTGQNARTLGVGTVRGHGTTGQIETLRGATTAFAGTRSDPFFFDLSAFLGVVVGPPNGRTFCDGPAGEGTDFFAPLNTNAIVLEVPDDTLGTHIGVWATTSSDGVQIDRMGRPAINAVFNKGEDKNTFNASQPATQYADYADNVISTLLAFSALDAEGAYTEEQATALTGVLLPDVVTYDTTTAAAGPLNGRALADDVIDAELNIVTGGFPFDGRDGEGAIGSDCVGAHDDLLGGFPYLGGPHS
jgi:hypothetical protein